MIAHILPILAVIAGLGVRAVPVPAPEGVTALLTPGTVLEGCFINYPGVHGISVQHVGSAARSGVARGTEGAAPAVSAGGATEKLNRRRTVTQIPDGQIQAPQKRSTLGVRQNGYPLKVTLKNGVLTDNLGRIGYIADNRQFQFDGPPQAGAIYTAGFSACPDGTLALGSSNIFYACGSSDFTNLYDTLVYPDNCREVKLFLH